MNRFDLYIAPIIIALTWISALYLLIVLFLAVHKWKEE